MIIKMRRKNYTASKEGHKPEEFLNSLENNFKENLFGPGVYSGKLLLLNECVVQANYSSKINQNFMSIYNENSMDKIEKTKSLLEQKTGWKIRI